MIINPIIPIWIMGIICILCIFLIKNKDKYVFIRRCVIVLLLFVINLRIMIYSPNEQVFQNNLDVMFVIDNTISMLAEDYDGENTRLEGVKKDCSYIIDELAGARMSVITFHNDSQILMPYTKDTTSVLETINALKGMDELYARGSSLNTPMEDMKQLLESSEKKENRNRIVFYISDGEITNDDTLQSFSDLKPYIQNGAVLGYGTEQGGYMKVTDSYTNTSTYLEDTTTRFPYEKAVSKLDEDNLKSIASDLGISYIHMEQQSDINAKIQEIKNEQIKNVEGEDKSSYVDIYYIFAIPLVILLMYELIYYKRKLI